MKTLKTAFIHTFAGDATNQQMGLVFTVIAAVVIPVITLIGGIK